MCEFVQIYMCVCVYVFVCVIMCVCVWLCAPAFKKQINRGSKFKLTGRPLSSKHKKECKHTHTHEYIHTYIHTHTQ